MRRRSFRTLVLPALMMAFVAMLLSPLSTFAAATSSSSHGVPHFFWHSNLRSQMSKTASVRPHASSNNLIYNGGQVEYGTTTVYAIFWEPTGSVSANYNSLILRYFKDVGATGLYRNNTQYKDSSGRAASGAVLGGSWVDTSSYPESPLLDSDIQAEAARAQSVKGWKASIHNIFFVFTEQGQDLCFDSAGSQCASNTFCAYHSNNGSTLYAAMPYAASFSCNPGSSPNNDDADQTINVTSHEQMEAATDPNGDAWLDSSGQEIGDKCAWTFGSLNSKGGDVTWSGHSYIVQKEWDNKIGGCALTGP